MTSRRCSTTGKAAHAGPMNAARALGRAKARAQMWGEVEPVRYYRCNFCRKFHLTSQPLKTEPLHKR